MIKRVLGAILLTAMVAVPAQAGLIVTIADTVMTEGDTTGIIDVFVSAETGTTVDLDNFGLEFVITPGTPRQIQFAGSQTFPGLTANPIYVFFSPGGSPYGGALTSVFTNDTFVGGDFTVPPGPVSVPDADVLLTRLQIVAGAGPLAPIAGDVFTVSLVNPSVNTFFDDGSFNNDILFDAYSGKVTFQSAAVPEPSSLVLFLGMAGTFWAGWRVHRRRAG